MDSVGRYTILRRLGAGGMGEVFLANDTQLDRPVAVKRLALTDAPDQKRLALKEARVVARLTHPHIAQLYDVVEEQGVVHLVMEFVEGQTLAASIAEGLCSESRTRTIGSQVADALAFAHAHGVVHCDVKPSNVMLSRTGQAKLLDFGIAQIERTTGTGAGTTSEIVIRGTPPYTAPEVMLGGSPTPRSDIFSLGVTLFEMLTGRRPFDAAPGQQFNPTRPAPSVRDFAPSVSTSLSALLSKTIAMSPDARPASAADVRDQLATTPHVPRHAAWRLSWLTAGVAAALLALVSTAVVMLREPSRLSAPTPPVFGVAVRNLTGEESRDHLAAGLAESLVTRLSVVPGLSVVPAGAMSPFVGQPDGMSAATITIGLSHVLSGTLQGSPQALRMTLLLLDRSGKAAWGTTIDGTETHFVDFQQRASAVLLSALRIRGLGGPDQLNAAASRPTNSDEAFELWSYGRAVLERSDVPGNLDRAIRFFERSVESDPTFGWAHASLGESCWRKYRDTRDDAWISRARASLDRALALAPDDPTVRYALAVLEHGTGRIEDALESLRQVIARQPASDAAYRLRARIASERGDLGSAIDSLREATAIRGDDPSTVRALGLAYFDAGRLDEAIASFSRLTALQPDNASGFQMLGTAHHAAGELDRALVAYQRANAIAPRATAYSNIGTIHYARRDFEAAADSYKKALAIQPREPATRRNLAEALEQLGKNTEARREYEAAIGFLGDALQINQADGRTWALMALCQARTGRVDAAESSLKRALALAHDDSEVAYKSALVALALGRDGDALKARDRAMSLGYSRSIAAADLAWSRLQSADK